MSRASSGLATGHCHAQQILRPLAWTVAFACVSGWAHANAQIQATASYRLDGGSTVVLSDPLSGTQSTGQVDVLAFDEAPLGYSSAGLHTYGSTSGDFGSRSSGQGHYDVTGRFVISRTITNATDTAQEARFNFFITPGLLNNEVRSDLSAPGSFVDAGIQFGIQRNGVQVWGSQAQLRTDAAGTVFNQSGANLYTLAGPSTYTIQGGAQSVSLGVLGAGESITVQYELSTFARGLAPTPIEPFLVPSQTVVVPEQTVFYPEATYEVWVPDGSDGAGDGCDGPQLQSVSAEFAEVEGCGGGRWEIRTREAYTEIIPEQTVTVGSYTSVRPSGSHASSGDPFEIDFTGRTQTLFDPITFQPLTPGASPFSITVTPVPEPSTWLLMVSGLMAVGTLAARRRLTSKTAG